MLREKNEQQLTNRYQFKQGPRIVANPVTLRPSRLIFKGALLDLCQFLSTESSLTVTKNAFYFTLKSLFVLKYLNFCLEFLVMQKKSLIRNIRLILKFMTSQPEKQIIPMQILPNISRSKGNQTTKFAQLTECNMRNIFLEKSYIKCGDKTLF